MRNFRKSVMTSRNVRKPSALLLKLVARITGWLQRLLARWYPSRIKATVRAAVADFSRMHFETLEPRLLMSGDLIPAVVPSAVYGPQFQFLQAETSTLSDPAAHRAMPLAVGAAATPSATATDADGTVITVTLTGPGSVELLAQGAGYALSVTGSTAASSLLLTATGGDGRVRLTDIQVASPLGEANLAAADFSGSADFGGVAKLSLGDISGASITNGMAGEASFNAKHVSDLRLTAPAAKLTVNVTDWTATVLGASPGASLLSGGALASLVTSGAFNADLRLSGIGFTGNILSNVAIGGALSGGQWFITGRANSVQADSVSGAWRGQFTGVLTQLGTRGDLSGFIAAGGIQQLIVGGSLRGATILVGARLGSDSQLGGNGSAADQFGPGTLARLRVTGDVVDSRIAVAIDPVNGILFDGNDITVGTAANKVQELVVGGQLLGSSLIVAPGFPASVRVNGAAVDPATIPLLATSTRDAVVPQLTAALNADTGTLDSDGISNSAALRLRVVDTGGVGAVRGRIGTGVFQNLAYTVQGDGSFLVSAASLAALNGGSLPDGSYSVELEAADVAGNRSARV
ncbi:MAG: LEPR-XLL domain-containing protein, partial [Microbacteriaceae bacterium]|nr:LEPR-XLL domain-containing protein [Burkholderiaceae bacterium]